MGAINLVYDMVAGNYWGRIKTDLANSATVIYTGYHVSPTAADSDPNWHILRDSISATLIDTQGPLVGTWTGRASLGW